MMINIRQALIVSKKEFKSYFVSPIAYIVIIIFLFIINWFYITPFFYQKQASMRTFFSLLPIVMVFIVPAVTMKLFSEEINSGSYELIATLPISTLEIVLGKYLSAIYFIVFMLLPTLLYPVSLSLIGDFDIGLILGGYVGSLFLGGAFAAIGLFSSSLTKNQIVSFMTGVVICFTLWGIEMMLDFIPADIVSFLRYLCSDFHFRNISKGVFDFRDFLYFISLIFVFLYSSILYLDNKDK